MRGLWMAAVAVAVGGVAVAEDKKGEDVKVGALKATAPGNWKPLATPGMMRSLQFTVPKADGDKEDADVSVFELKAAGTVEQNLKRQLGKFTPAKGKDAVEEKVEKIKVGGVDATYQDVKGTFMKKKGPNVPGAGDPFPDYRQLYVVWENKEGEQVYIWLVGPAKTVEANKKAFDEFLKGLK